MENQFQTEIQPETRTQTLTAFCVLSFIANGFGILFSLFGIFGANAIFESFQNMATDSSLMGLSERDAEQLQFAFEKISTFGSSIFVIVFSFYLVFCLISLFGVIKIWNLKKIGFWFYSIPNGIMCLLYFVSGSWLIAIVGVIFIVVFANHLKFMK